MIWRILIAQKIKGMLAWLFRLGMVVICIDARLSCDVTHLALQEKIFTIWNLILMDTRGSCINFATYRNLTVTYIISTNF